MSQGYPGLGYRAAGDSAIDVRSRFITRTYNHLFGAIVAFTAIEIGLFKSGLAEPIAGAMLGGSWLLVLGGFMVASFVATHVAHTSRSLGAQYLGLLGYVIAQAIIFVP